MAYSAVGTGSGTTPPVQMVATAAAFLAKVPQDLLGDNVLVPSPVLWAMTRRGKMGGSGAAINYGALAVINTNQGAYYGDQLLNNNVTDETRPIEQQWKFNYQAVTVPVTDLVLQYGSGMTGVRDLLTLKLMIAAGSMTDYLSKALWHTSPANTSLDIDDLDSWIGSTTNTIGGTNRSTAANSWWRPQTPITTQNGTSMSPLDAETAYQTCGFAFDYPDMAVMRPSPYATFKNNFTQNIRYLDKDEATNPDGSFRNHFLFNNAVVLADRFVPSGASYFFASKYIYPKFHEADYFTIDPWLKPSRQRVLTTAMYIAWNIVSPAPRLAGIKVNGTT